MGLCIISDVRGLDVKEGNSEPPVTMSLACSEHRLPVLGAQGRQSPGWPHPGPHGVGGEAHNEGPIFHTQRLRSTSLQRPHGQVGSGEGPASVDLEASETVVWETGETIYCRLLSRFIFYIYGETSIYVPLTSTVALSLRWPSLSPK